MSPPDPRDHEAHDPEALSEALDGRLARDRHAAVLELVRSCPECRAAYEALAWTKAQAARVGAVAIPSGLEAEIRRGLAAAGARPRRPRGRRTAALAAAVVLMGLAVVLSRLASGPAPLPEAIADDFRARSAGLASVGLETSDPARLEAWLGSAPLGIPTRVFDLGMMGIELVGGGADTVAGRPSAVVVYRERATGRLVICRMLRGGLAELPPPLSERVHDGIAFHVHARDGLTLVFWPEADVLCVLVSDGEPEALLQLAFAKAVKARTSRS
jgi:anti-sigma factor RsiW